ncbi:MAG TPA: hypothetical protein VMD59_15440 [Acidimicrobiales bacterium]|nr:hypothetical protein [Acidimicrobiales bacterium]
MRTTSRMHAMAGHAVSVTTRALAHLPAGERRKQPDDRCSFDDQPQHDDQHGGDHQQCEHVSHPPFSTRWQ